MMSSPNLCRKRWIWEQYDFMVRTNTVVGPGYDAAVLRLKERRRLLAMSTDCNPRYCYSGPGQWGSGGRSGGLQEHCLRGRCAAGSDELP